MLATHLPFVKPWRVSLSGTTACNRLGDKERLEKEGDEISMVTSKSPSFKSPSRSVASESDTISSGSPVLDRFSHAFCGLKPLPRSSPRIGSVDIRNGLMMSTLVETTFATIAVIQRML